MPVLNENNSNNQLTPWHSYDVEALRSELQVGIDGLTAEDAKARLGTCGPNEIPKGKKTTTWELIWSQINNPLVWVLIGAGLVAMAADPVGGIKNGLVIFGVVVLNTVIGTLQEGKARKAIEALDQMVPDRAIVIREGQNLDIDAREVVPGDWIQLASGDRVPADARLIAIKGLMVEEASLTGESVPVEKSLTVLEAKTDLGDQLNMVFAGTMVVAGTAQAIVTSTGAQTQLGLISSMLRNADHLDTPLTKAMAKLGKTVSLGIIALAVAMLVVGVWRTMASTGVPFTKAFQETVLFAISLAVGAIPEGLPALITIALAIGVQRMAKRRSIVRKLPAIETLGSTTVICTDKTGTLTQNKMTVETYWLPSSDRSVEELVMAAALCNDASPTSEGAVGDPTEVALADWALKSGVSVGSTRDKHTRIDVIPFESERQYMATLHKGGTAYKKGAPEVVLSRCSEVDAAAALDRVHAMADDGLRVLALASKKNIQSLNHENPGDDWTFLGLVGMIDPPRPEAIKAIARCQRAGISVKMITGDHRATASAIAKELGIKQDAPALTGHELNDMDDEAFSQAAARTSVFARVAPEHKLRLVKVLQKQGNVVAMTGDGVNDAPALKQADIGVAMGITGTAVSKDASDVVLTDDNFATIAAAVEEGRRVYDNLIKSLAFVLPTNLSLAITFGIALVLFPFDAVTRELLLPMAPMQLLWINMVASVALGVPLAFEAMERGIMDRKPRAPGTPILSKNLVVRTAVVAVLMAAAACMVFMWEYRTILANGFPDELARREAQTLAVNTLTFFQIFYLLMCRTLHGPIKSIGWFSNKTIYAGIGALLLLQAAFVYVPFMNDLFETAPIDLRSWLIAGLCGFTVVPVIYAIRKFEERAQRDEAH